MSSTLTKKTILLISPQSWDLVKVSKHHYAITLAALGNEVYFLNPPQKTAKGIEIKPTGHENLWQINYSTFFPVAIRFHVKKLFNFLMRFQVVHLKKAIGKEIDIVWCFEPNLFSDLNVFNSRIKIFHPVDVFEQPSAREIAATADVIFSVSPSILDIFSDIKVPKYFINHGLGKEFEQYALKLKQTDNFQDLNDKKALTIGYIGNLLIKFMNRELLMHLVSNFPDLKFILIGPYEESQSSLKGADEKAAKFVEFLKKQPNVLLTGPQGGTDLIRYMEMCDVFLLCYTGRIGGYDLSNSHKILEYLSTGKPVISTPIVAYKDNNDLILMPSTNDEETFPAYFMNELKSVAKIDNSYLRNARLNFAIANSYERQVKKVEDILNNLISNRN